MSTSKPANRAEFKAMLLRKLGAPVIQINVADVQVDDCVEEALKYYTDYHYDGSEHVYYTHTVVQDDIDNRYFDVPDNIIGISEVYSLANSGFSTFNSADMFSGGYQMAFDFVWSSSTGSLLSYYMNKTQYEFMNQILIGQTPIRYNRHLNRIHLDTNWNRIPLGSKIVLDGYMRNDPDVNTDIWNDRWLIKYATAKVKWIWGSVLSKYDGVQLPGGGSLNGTKIQDDAHDEIQALEDEMITSYSIPPRDYIG